MSRSRQCVIWLKSFRTCLPYYSNTAYPFWAFEYFSSVVSLKRRTFLFNPLNSLSTPSVNTITELSTNTSWISNNFERMNCTFQIDWGAFSIPHTNSIDVLRMKMKMRMRISLINGKIEAPVSFSKQTPSFRWAMTNSWKEECFKQHRAPFQSTEGLSLFCIYVSLLFWASAS
jgi:hypothetical protein